MNSDQVAQNRPGGVKKVVRHQTISCYHTGYHMDHIDVTICHHMGNL